MLDNYTSGKGTEYSKVSQKNLDKLLVEFIISETHPLSIVEKLILIKLVQFGLPKEIKVISRKIIKLRIENMCTNMIENIITKLLNVLYIATTADC